MAPELTEKYLQFGFEVDIYSFGIVLWELFTGKSISILKTQGKSIRKKLNIITNNLPKWLDKLILQMVNVQPQKRPTSEFVYNQISKIWISYESNKNSSENKSEYYYPSFEADAYWKYFKQNSNTWKYFLEKEQKLIEENYKKYLNENACSSILIQPFDIFSNSLLLNFNEFKMFENETENPEIYYFRRKRIPKDPHSNTRFVVLSCECNLDSSLSFFVKSKDQTIEDCTDVVLSVTYCYKDEGEFIRTIKTKYPFSLTLQSNENEFVNICIELNGKPLQYFTYPLHFTSQKLPNYEISYFDDLTPQTNLIENFNYFKELNDNSLIPKKEILNILQNQCDVILSTILLHCQEYSPLILLNNGKFEENFGLFNGISGYAYFLLKAAKSGFYDDKKELLLSTAASVLRIAVNRTEYDFSNISFLQGSAGILAVQAVVSYEQKNIQDCASALQKLLKLSRMFSIAPAMFEKDVFEGYSGYMLSLLYVIKYLPPIIYLNSDIKLILERLFKIICNNISNDIIYYKYKNAFDYYGAGHGLAGILFTLLQFKNLSKNNEFKPVILNSIDFLISNIDENKEILVRKFSSEKNYYWCSGIVGIIPTLLMAYQRFKIDKYLHKAIEICDNIWKNGLLKNGFFLCHGTAGSIYSLLHVYHVTDNDTFLNQAFMLCQTINDSRVQSIVNGYQDFGKLHCFSLMEGICGTGCLALDMLKDPKNAAFPGYFNDVQSISM